MCVSKLQMKGKSMLDKAVIAAKVRELTPSLSSVKRGSFDWHITVGRRQMADAILVWLDNAPEVLDVSGYEALKAENERLHAMVDDLREERDAACRRAATTESRVKTGIAERIRAMRKEWLANGFAENMTSVIGIVIGIDNILAELEPPAFAGVEAYNKVVSEGVTMCRRSDIDVRMYPGKATAVYCRIKDWDADIEATDWVVTE